MRVISGSARGRKLVAPERSTTRPTSDRVREATFNAIGSLGAVQEAAVLDLFAGSGAMGIEALSRGAARATFVDHDLAARRAIEANLTSCGLTHAAEVVAATAEQFLAGAGRQRRAAFSLVAAVVVAVGITLTEEPDPFLGGLRLHATVIPVIEAVIAVSMTLWITDCVRRRWDRASTLTHAAASASFAAYLLHAPITIALSAALSDVGVPAELKFLAVFAATVFASFGLGWLHTRSHVGGRIL
ncbi:MAG: RsmD family RNA methyltransferase [Ilumatobacteraceae bacterium]|nr:MAG: RsmD family RNA methyltransferase [Actinomycetota bacterium]